MRSVKYFLSFFKGDRQILDILEFIADEVVPKRGHAAKKGKKMLQGSIDFPVLEKVGITGDVDDYVTSVNNETPKLYLFFTDDGGFDIAEVAADKHALHLQANDVIYAVVLFISVYFVSLGLSKKSKSIFSFSASCVLADTV